MDRYSAERVLHLERQLVLTIAQDDGSVFLRDSRYTNSELHIVARVSRSESHLVQSFYRIGVVRDEMPGLASRLAEALAMAVDIYSGPAKPDDDWPWPGCGCKLTGCADPDGVVLPSPFHEVAR